MIKAIDLLNNLIFQHILAASKISFFRHSKILPCIISKPNSDPWTGSWAMISRSNSVVNCRTWNWVLCGGFAIEFKVKKDDCQQCLFNLLHASPLSHWLSREPMALNLSVVLYTVPKFILVVSTSRRDHKWVRPLDQEVLVKPLKMVLPSGTTLLPRWSKFKISIKKGTLK